MMRKLVRQGAATLMVSIPSKWAKQHNLGKGSEVEVNDEDSSLIINPTRKKDKRIKELNIKKGQFMRRLFYIPYREGYDEINVIFEDSDTMNEINSVVEMMMGFEITDQGANHCTVGTVSVEEEQSFEKVLRRCFLLIKSMAKESNEALQKKEFGKMRAIGDMERSVHRYCEFTMRIINKTWLKPKPEITRTYWIITILKEISDFLAETCNYMYSKKPNISKNYADLYSKVVGLISKLNEIYYKPDTNSLAQFKKTNSSVVESAKRLVSGNQPIIAHNLLSIAERVRRAQELLV